MKLKIASHANEQRNTIFGGLLPYTLVNCKVLVPMNQLSCWGDLRSRRSCVPERVELRSQERFGTETLVLNFKKEKQVTS